MVREALAIAELTGETVRAMQGFGRKVSGTIQGHQQLVAKDPKVCQHVVLFQALKDLNKHRIEGARGDWIEQLADLIITGNLLHAQQGVGIILALGLLQPALVVQKRRRLGKEDAKGTESSILDAVSGVCPFFTRVRQWIEMSVYDALEIIEA